MSSTFVHRPQFFLFSEIILHQTLTMFSVFTSAIARFCCGGVHCDNTYQIMDLPELLQPYDEQGLNCLDF